MPAFSRHWRIPGTLWAGRLSQTTMLPGGSSGIRCSVSHCWKMRPVMGVSIGIGASMPSWRRPATNVESSSGRAAPYPAAACPCGPSSRVMLVIVPVSSTNINRLKSSRPAGPIKVFFDGMPCAARQISRAMATSGRSCSVA